MRELINIDDIECPEIRKNAQICQQEILKFNEIMRNHIVFASTHNSLNIKEIFKIQSEDPVLRAENMFVRVTKNKSTGYRGNTKVDANDYKIIWAFDLTGKKVESYSLYDFDKRWIEKTLYYVFEQDEYLPEHEAQKSRFFSIYVAGLEYRENGLIDDHHVKLAHNNDNMELTSILTPKVATRTIDEMNKVIREYLLLEDIKKEMNK